MVDWPVLVAGSRLAADQVDDDDDDAGVVDVGHCDELLGQRRRL